MPAISIPSYKVVLVNQGVGNKMRFSYNKLWKLLIDKGMNRQDLKRVSGLSSTCIAKLGKGENVTTDVLLRICVALNCDVSDIVECVEIAGKEN